MLYVIVPQKYRYWTDWTMELHMPQKNISIWFLYFLVKTRLKIINHVFPVLPAAHTQISTGGEGEVGRVGEARSSLRAGFWKSTITHIFLVKLFNFNIL